MRRFLITGACTLLLASCGSQLRERLEIVFDRDGSAIVKLDVSIADDSGHSERAVRMNAIRGELLDQRDAWSRRFERLRPKQESLTLEKEQGRLVKVERTAKINPQDLGLLFNDTAIQLSYLEDRGVAELSIFAGTSERATREQIRAFNETADAWSGDVAAYYRAIDQLYRYIASNGDRAKPMMAVIFDLNSEDDGETIALTDEERTITERVTDAIDTIVVPGAEGSGLTADELTSLVNDPFPAELVIRPGGEILELEGFERDPEAGGVRVRRVTLLDALESMRSRWASPDPFFEMLDHVRRGDDAPPFDLGALVSKPRRAAPPANWREVRTALDEALRMPATYRVSWRKP